MKERTKLNDYSKDHSVRFNPLVVRVCEAIVYRCPPRVNSSCKSSSSSSTSSSSDSSYSENWKQQQQQDQRKQQRKQQQHHPPPSMKFVLEINTAAAMTTTMSSQLQASAMRRRSEELMQLIQHRNWKAVQSRLEESPTDADYFSHASQKTPLHLALMNRAPFSVVSLLVQAYPTALLFQDREGWTPLHVNLLYGGGGDNDGEGGQEVAEHTTLFLIRQGGRTAACLHSKFVGSPLHLACRRGTNNLILKELLQVAPNQVRVPNQYGMTPANLLWKTFLVRHINNNNNNNNNNDESLFEEEPSSESQILLEQLCLLLQTFKNSSSSTTTIHTTTLRNDIKQQQPIPIITLEDVIDFQSRHADETDFVSLFLRFHPESLINSNFALHRAAAYQPKRLQQQLQPEKTTTSVSSSSPPSEDVVLLSPPPPLAPRDPLKLVLERLLILPDSATAAASRVDSSGRLPLHHALSCGQRKWWNTSSSSSNHHPKTTHPDNLLLQQLLRANHESLMQRDPVTGLYPFQLAAVVGSGNGSVDSDASAASSSETKKLVMMEVAASEQQLCDIVETEVVETIYELLHACPHAIRSIHDSDNDNTNQHH